MATQWLKDATSDKTFRKVKREGEGGGSRREGGGGGSIHCVSTSKIIPRSSFDLVQEGRGGSCPLRSRVATSDKTLRKFKREGGGSYPLRSRVANISGECFRMAGYSAVTPQVWEFSVSYLNNSAISTISAVCRRYLQYLQLHAFLDISPTTPTTWFTTVDPLFIYIPAETDIVTNLCYAVKTLTKKGSNFSNISIQKMNKKLCLPKHFKT